MCFANTFEDFYEPKLLLCKNEYPDCCSNDITCNSAEKFQQKITPAISGQFLLSWMTQKSPKTEASFIYPMSHHCQREREREREQRDMIQHPIYTMGRGGRKRNWKPECECLCLTEKKSVSQWQCVCVCVCVCVCEWVTEKER